MTGDQIRLPEDFRYKEAFLMGPPHHEPFDDFRIKHPPMPLSKRAKIFSPFAALRGFDREIVAKQVEYEEKHILSEGEKEELSRRLSILWSLTRNNRMIRENPIRVSVIWFRPCEDRHHEAYGAGGRYVTDTGTVRQVNQEYIRIDDLKIDLRDILALESDAVVDGYEFFAEPREVEGARKVIAAEYQLNIPACVRAAVNAYRDRNGWLSFFLDECCEANPDYGEKPGSVY